MAGFKVGPEAQKRFMAKLREEQQANRARLQRDLEAKAAADPEGGAGIWAEMLAENIARNGDLR